MHTLSFPSLQLSALCRLTPQLCLTGVTVTWSVGVRLKLLTGWIPNIKHWIYICIYIFILHHFLLKVGAETDQELTLYNDSPHSHWSKYWTHLSQATYLLDILTVKWDLSDWQSRRKVALFEIGLCLSSTLSEIWSEHIKLAEKNKTRKHGICTVSNSLSVCVSVKIAQWEGGTDDHTHLGVRRYITFNTVAAAWVSLVGALMMAHITHHAVLNWVIC